MNRIKQIREEAGLTQTEFGELFGVVKQTVSSWENGISNPTAETLMDISVHFGVATDYLLGISDQRETSINTLGKLIKQLREGEDLTQKELADILLINRSTLAGYETDNKQPPYHVLVRLANYFDTTVDYLLGRPEKEKAANASENQDIMDIVQLAEQLPREALLEFKGELRGYIRRMKHE